MRSPERADTQVEKDRHNQYRNQKRSVIGAVRPTGPHAPEIRRKNDHRQQEEDACHFEPNDAAHASEGSKKAAHAACHASTRFHGCSRGVLRSRLNANCRICNRLSLRYVLRLVLRRHRRFHRSGHSLAHHFAGDAQPGAKDASNDLRSHSVYDGSSDAGSHASRRLPPFYGCSI